MADFSCYDGPSDEWLAVQETLPPATIGEGESLIARRVANNRNREELAAEAMKSLAPQIQLKDYSVPTRDGSQLEARTYRPTSADPTAALPVYIHLHGGGYMFGTLSSEDAICTRIALGADVVVLNVNYRHTPEHVYPTAWNDVEDAFSWLAGHIGPVGGHKDKVVIGGISAGAQIAASLTLQRHLQDATKPLPIAGQILMIPCLTHITCTEPQLKKLRDPDVSSYRTNADAPLLPLKTAQLFSDLLQIPNPSVDDTMLSPGNATPEQVAGLPPTVFGIAGLDPLRDDGLLYAKMLTEAGVPTDVNLFKGVPHGFRRFGDRLSASARWDKVMEDGIRWVLSNPPASSEFVIKA